MPSPVHVTLTMSRVAVGVPITQEPFHYGLFAADGALMRNASSSQDKRIIFHDVHFDNEGIYLCTIRETSHPQEWKPDLRIWPVEFHVTAVAAQLECRVIYPEGIPRFFNELVACTTCGSIVFPELCFDAPGIYEYTMIEETPSGDGWETDDRVVRVMVHVEDDGHGNLFAYFEYPDGFPTFTNTRTLNPVCVEFRGCKIAIGAPLPEGRFTFGLYDEAGELVATTTNGPADETEDED